MRHPKNPIIMQIQGCLIDCSEIANILCAEATNSDARLITIGFRGCDRTIDLEFADHEGAAIFVAEMKRGMLASITGNPDYLDGRESL